MKFKKKKKLTSENLKIIFLLKYKFQKKLFFQKKKEKEIEKTI
jgi:hypothetical protein